MSKVIKNFQNFINTSVYKVSNDILKREINELHRDKKGKKALMRMAAPGEITIPNYGLFKKTPEERALLKKLKKECINKELVPLFRGAF